jgi:hypothetical protein
LVEALTGPSSQQSERIAIGDPDNLAVVFLSQSRESKQEHYEGQQEKVLPDKRSHFGSDVPHGRVSFVRHLSL